MSGIGARIKNRRKQLNISADTLAKQLGISKSTIYRYENGEIEKIPSNILDRMAKTLNTSVEYLMDKEHDTSNLMLPIFAYYETLNDLGKNEAEKRIEELTHIEKYTDPKIQLYEKEVSEELCSEFTSPDEARAFLRSQSWLAALKETDAEINDIDVINIANAIRRDSYGRK